MNEGDVVRRFLYVGFAICSIMLVVTLSLGVEGWPAALVGTLVYGVPAFAIYRQEQERAENRETVDRAAAKSSRGLVIADQDDEASGGDR